jgi:hypothetical protein
MKSQDLKARGSLLEPFVNESEELVPTLPASLSFMT